jgi:signal transduction histidine kinase
MAALLLVPLCLISALAIAKLIEAEREARLDAAAESANAGVLLIERELAVAEASLRSLVHTPAMKSGDLAQLYQHAAANNAGQPGSWTVMASAEGRPLMNTLVPWGTPLPKVTGRWAGQVIAAQRTRVSGYFVGTVAQRPTIAVDMPVPDLRGRPAVLSQVFDASRFTRLFTGSQLPDSWMIGIFDADGVIIARSQDSARAAGTRTHPALFQASRAQAKGVVRLNTRTRMDVYVVFARSPMSNWTVAIGVPVDEIDAAAKSAVYYAIFVVACLAAAAILGASFFANRLVAALRSAADASDGLAKGRDVPIRLRTKVVEVDQMLGRMLASSRMLSRTLAQREELEAERTRLLAVEQDARRAAEAESKAKDEFIAMLGHELRNPLAAIAAAQQLLTFPNISQQQREHALVVCSRQMAHLTQIVDQLLDLHRIATGKIELAMASVPLHEVVANSCEVKRLVDGDGHRWHCEVRPVTIQGNRERLTQILDNLLDNAAKYTPAGGAIRVRCYRSEDSAVVEVEDDGAGMDSDLIARVFQPLVQGATTIDRAKGGLGLGLAVVSQLTQLHGGTASAHSDGPGRGSLFRLAFPIIGADAPSGLLLEVS